MLIRIEASSTGMTSLANLETGSEIHTTLYSLDFAKEEQQVPLGMRPLAAHLLLVERSAIQPALVALNASGFADCGQSGPTMSGFAPLCTPVTIERGQSCGTSVLQGILRWIKYPARKTCNQLRETACLPPGAAGGRHNRETITTDLAAACIHPGTVAHARMTSRSNAASPASP